jgi:predicted RNase H-like HicB family nuclease
MFEYTIILTWDDEASVWIAESQDLPGLILESDSFDTLVERVKTAVPELLELSGTDHTQVKLHFKAECLAVVA